MRKFYCLLTLLVMSVSGLSAQSDLFANYTVSPASGSTISDSELTQIVLTFHDLYSVDYTRSGCYKIYKKAEYEALGPDAYYINKPEPTFLEYDGVCDISENEVTVNIKEVIPESGEYIIIFGKNSFVDDWSEEVNEDEIAIEYNIVKKSVPYNVSPSNDAPISMVDLWPIVVTFPTATTVTLLDTFGKYAKVMLLDPHGNEITSREYNKNRSDWTADGNSMKVEFYEFDRQKFTEEGEYTVLFTQGSVILDGKSQDEIKIKYDVTLPERPAEGPVDLAFADYIDEDDKLYFTYPAEFERAHGHSFEGYDIIDATGSKVGNAESIDIVEGEKNKWYMKMNFRNGKDPMQQYSIDVNEGLLTMYDVYHVEHKTAAKTVKFYGGKGGTDVTELTDRPAAKTYFTLEGVQIANPVPGSVYIERCGAKTRTVVGRK